MHHDNRIWLFALGLLVGAIVITGALATVPHANGHYAHFTKAN